MHSEVRLAFEADCSSDSMRPDSAVAALRQYKETGEDLHGIPSLAEQQVLQSARDIAAGSRCLS